MTLFNRMAVCATLVLGLAVLDTPAIAAVPAPPTLAPVLKAVSPGVVNIAIEGTMASQPNPLFNDPFFRQFFGNMPNQPAKQKFQAVGSGVVFDAEHGYVMTNNHVVAHADRIMVRLSDRREVRAKLIGTDPQTDIAVLKIPTDHLTAVPFGDSTGLQVGDYVVALGDPFGLGQTATFGIVSALGRTGLGIEGYEDFIQTDAAINPGNSGGALIDMNGKLIGINTAILTGGGEGSVGIGFAIPVAMAKQVADQLIAHGKIERGQIGVMVQDLTPEIAKAMGISQSSGALVSQVLPHSPAAKAGLKAGDVVLQLNGKPLRGSSDLRNTVGLTAPGTVVNLTILHKGEQKTVAITLEKASEHQEEATAPDESVLDGVKLGPIPSDHPLSGKVTGVYVEAIRRDSRAGEEGLRPGDVIVAIDQQAVSSAGELLKILKEHDSEPAVLDVRRGDETLVLVLQ